MSRLYYETPKPKGLDKYLENKQGGDKPASEYLSKVAALVPSEIIGGYLAMMGFAETFKTDQQYPFVIWGIFLFGFIATPFYLNKMAEAGKPKIKHIIVSTFAYLFWVYITSGEVLQGTVTDIAYHTGIASILLIAFSIVSGFVTLDK
ncbi:hypothetical protein [Pedobacter sp.]|uniref:hypothetical protein n=1 Tax=Pedobacter sp. TaxID=1411316 RepID=UPI003BAC5918